MTSSPSIDLVELKPGDRLRLNDGSDAVVLKARKAAAFIQPSGVRPRWIPRWQERSRVNTAQAAPAAEGPNSEAQKPLGQEERQMAKAPQARGGLAAENARMKAAPAVTSSLCAQGTGSAHSGDEPKSKRPPGPVFGLSMCDGIKALAACGANDGQIRVSIERMGLKPAESTLKINAKIGRKDAKVWEFKLSDEQIKELLAP